MVRIIEVVIMRNSALHFSLKRSKDEGEGDGNEIDKKKKGFTSKTTLHVHDTFGTFLCCHCT